MNKREEKTKLKRILHRYDWKNPPCMNARVLKDAVYFSKESGLELPPEFSQIIIVKVFRLIYDRETAPHLTTRALDWRPAPFKGDFIQSDLFSVTGADPTPAANQ